MAAHIVTCRICGEKFDINKIQGVKIGNLRYAHKECADREHKDYEIVPLNTEQKDKDELIEYVKEQLGESYIKTKVAKQIKQYYNEEGYSYSGMLKTLKWYHEVQGNNWDKAQGGIGIIPYIYKNAMDYYYAIYLAQLSSENLTQEDIKKKEREVIIVPPEHKNNKPPVLFNLD